jgi:hypothetical protein
MGQTPPSGARGKRTVTHSILQRPADGVSDTRPCRAARVRSVSEGNVGVEGSGRLFTSWRQAVARRLRSVSRAPQGDSRFAAGAIIPIGEHHLSVVGLDDLPAQRQADP